jgi:hypothetical protein
MSKPKPHAAESAKSKPARLAVTVDPDDSAADHRLDEALDESFPASDPIAVDITDPHHAQPEHKKRR